MEPSKRIDRLGACPVFTHLPAESLQRLAELAEPLEAAPGQVLMQERDISSDLFVVASGTAVVARAQPSGGELIVGRVGAGEMLGEMQALARGRRMATVRAETAMSLLRLPSEGFDAIVADDPAILTALSEYIRDRHRRFELKKALEARYRAVGEAAIRELEAVVRWRHLERGEVLLERGARPEAIWFVLSGGLESVAPSDADRGDAVDRPPIYVAPGEVLADAVTLSGEPSFAGIWAARPSEVAELPREAFERIVARHPALARPLFEATLERVKKPKRGRPGGQTVALVPIGRDIPIRDVIGRLLEALDEDLTAALINRITVRRQFGSAPDLAELDTADPRALRLSAFLDQVDAAHDVVVYQVDHCDSAWARRCTTLAEQIVLVARATDDPRPAPEERRLLAMEKWPRPPHVVLVLLHEPNAQPSGTERWLTDRHVDVVLHVRLKDSRDIARVARFASRRATGVVMSGGAARGFAALGVLEALDELGVPVDATAGVSAGAVVAAGYARGWAPQAILGSLLGPSAIKALGFGIPTISFGSGKRFVNWIRESFGVMRLEDLWKPCFFVSTNLTRAAQKISTRGDLAEHLAASNAMPGLLPPVTLDGDICVDGAFVNNVPIAEMAAFLRGGPVIAVDVTPSVASFEAADRASLLGSGSEEPERSSVWSWFKKELPAVGAPNMFELLLRSQLIHHVAQMRSVQHLASLYLAPDVRQFGLASHFRAKEIARAGYEQCGAQIRRWWSERRARSAEKKYANSLIRDVRALRDLTPEE